MKPATFAPAYVALYPAFAEIARGHGYALAVHGSVQRDFDVICIPWAEVVSPPDAVIADVLSQFAVETVGEPTVKLHGRICYTVSIGFGDCFADWSFMPSADALPVGAPGAGEDGEAVLLQALEPFAKFAEAFVDKEGWKHPPMTERIVDWFGPSEFRAALTAKDGSE